MLVQDEKIDPRVKRTKQLLQKALMDLVREKPVDSITVQDIAARAEVNRATFYAHFEDKYALLDYTGREMFQASLDKKLAGTPGLTHDSLRLLVLTTCEYLDNFMGHCAPVTQLNNQALMFLQIQGQIYDTLISWIQSAKTVDSRDEATAVTVSWAIWGTVFQWVRQSNGRKPSAEQLADHVVALLSNGICDTLDRGAHP
jgi:AcrR family transcriptional regulator